MYTLFEPPEEFDGLKEESDGLIADILKEIEPTRKSLQLLRGQPLYEEVARKGNFYVVQDGGVLSYSRDGRILFFYEPGDLVGVEQYFDFGETKISSEFANFLDEYSGDEFLRQIDEVPYLRKKWQRYLVCQLSIFSCLLTAFVRSRDDVEPLVKSFAEGEVIIQQGAEESLVYHMVEGSADVFVDDVQVGEVLRDEIFGVLGALTGTPRTATVAARQNCVTLALNNENFVNLFSMRPGTVKKLIENFARLVVELNEKIVTFENTKT